MTNRFMQAVVTGMVATVVMTIVGLMAPLMGMPKMNPADMLSGMLGVSSFIGWLMHAMIGIIFASAYVYWFNPTVKIDNKFWKGIVFGFSVFVFAQIMMLMMGMFMTIPMMGDKMLSMVGSLVGHLIYGLFVAWIVPLPNPVKTKKDHYAAAG